MLRQTGRDWFALRRRSMRLMIGLGGILCTWDLLGWLGAPRYTTNWFELPKVLAK